MVFLSVDTNSYDIILGLDFLMKIGVVADVEKGVIQLQNGLGMAVELLPFTIVIMLHLVVEQKLSPNFQLVKEGMQSLSLKEQMHEEDLMTRPQVPCVTQKGSKELDLRKWSETWCRSQLPALKGVEGSCWKLRD
jgi:hypothetical protein